MTSGVGPLRIKTVMLSATQSKVLACIVMIQCVDRRGAGGS